MRELRPVPFNDHLSRLNKEIKQGKCFDLPERAYWAPKSGADLRVKFHGIDAATPIGPAAGPHSQMAQNILLSYMAGGRIMELKTVQIMDRLQIPRPCIDTRNIGFNIEWSQELRIEESLHEYVVGAWLINIARGENWIGAESVLEPENDPVIFDISVGYDLNGIKSRRVTDYLRSMMDITETVNRLEAQIKDTYPQYLKYKPKALLANTATLSTFHGCPPEEIEGIVSYLLEEIGLHVVVKMNPTMLGRERVDYLLRDKMGYEHLQTNPKAYEVGLPNEASHDLIRGLKSKADKLNLGLNVKFSNTLETLNTEGHLPKSEAVQYLSGAPLHVITTVLMDQWRREMNWQEPMSYSAGIDKVNFTHIARSGCVPITTCTDLLKPGGYQRLTDMLRAYESEMEKAGTKSLAEDIGSPEQRHKYLEDYARDLPEDSRYHNERNKRIPKKIKSHLDVFDCINCDKCIPVCPNDAMFSYETTAGEYATSMITFSPGEGFAIADHEKFTVGKEHQLANFAEYCNECGNCDTHCPENGGPFIEKPTFYMDREGWIQSVPSDAYHCTFEDDVPTIHARIDEREYSLQLHQNIDRAFLRDQFFLIEFDTESHAVVETNLSQVLLDGRMLDTGIYHRLRTLLEGVLLTEESNAVNVGRT